MLHNDVLRRLRYALSLDDTATISIFKLAHYDMDIPYLHAIMKKENEKGFTPCRDKVISLFLDGLIIKNRGDKDDTPPTLLKSGEKCTNNDVLRKIRIAMTYKDDDILNLLKSVGFRISKSELSAFFRKKDHRNFKECGDQLIRNLLKGMVKRYRPDAEATENKNVWGKPNPRVQRRR